MNQRTILRAACALALLFSCALFAACGKEGMPSPKKTQDTFTITRAGATPMGDCLVASGTVQGAVTNVDTVTIEVAPIISYDDCPGCPFVPQEYSEFSVNGIQLDLETGQFMFSFCPSTSAPMYRWRLVGKNAHLGLPHASTTPQVVIVRQQ